MCDRPTGTDRTALKATVVLFWSPWVAPVSLSPSQGGHASSVCAPAPHSDHMA